MANNDNQNNDSEIGLIVPLSGALPVFRVLLNLDLRPSPDDDYTLGGLDPDVDQEKAFTTLSRYEELHK